MTAWPAVRLRALLPGLAALAAATLVLGATPRHAAASAADAIVPELLPYTLATTDLPSGYTVFQVTASTNAAVAFASPAGQRQAALAALGTAGRITGVQQSFVPSSDSVGPEIHLVVELYTDPSAASAALEAVAPAAGATVVPDFSVPQISGARAAHTVASVDGAPRDTFTVAWSAGVVVLGVTSSGLHASAQAVAAIAQAAATKAASAAPPGGIQDTAGDARDLADAIALDASQLAESAAPPAFERGGAYLWSDAQIVLDSREPSRTFDTVTGVWGRVAGEAEYFEAADDSEAVITTGYALFGAADGANAALHDLSLLSSARQAVLPVAPPLALGDDTTAYQAVVLWPNNVLRDSYTVQWQHGDLILSVTVNQPAHTPPPSYLATVAQAFDAAYLANPPVLQ